MANSSVVVASAFELTDLELTNLLVVDEEECLLLVVVAAPEVDDFLEEDSVKFNIFRMAACNLTKKKLDLI